MYIHAEAAATAADNASTSHACRRRLAMKRVRSRGPSRAEATVSEGGDGGIGPPAFMRPMVLDDVTEPEVRA